MTALICVVNRDAALSECHKAQVQTHKTLRKECLITA